MKLLHVVHGYFPAIGGTELLIQKVSERLVERHRDEVNVLTTTAYNCELFWRRDQPQLPAGVEVINGVTVRRFPVFNRFNGLRRLLAAGSYRLRLPYNDWFRALYNGPLVRGMVDAIAGSGAEVVAGSSFPLLHMHYLLWGGERARIPVVFHGGIHPADADGFNRPMIYRAIHRAEAYIANTSFERDYLLERGVPYEKIHVIGVGVDAEPFAQTTGDSVRKRFGWDKQPVVAFVGQQVPHKGIDLVMKAMEQIWAEGLEVCLLIAGARTSYSKTIKSWIENLSPEQRSRVGLIDNFTVEEKPSIFAACDLLAFPSGNESFGIVFLEAWAAGKPVIGARVGAIPSVVDENKDGLLIRHRDVAELVAAIRKLVAQPELARELGAHGREKVQRRFTWDAIANQFRAVYFKVRKG